MLVFVGRDVPATWVGSLPVMGTASLVAWLLRRAEGALDLETGRRVCDALEALVAGARRRAAVTPAVTAIQDAKPMTLRTSASHPLQVACVRGLPTHGLLGMTFAPGMRAPSALGHAWLRDLDADLERLRTVHRADLLVSLMDRHEYGLLGVPDLLERAAAAGLETYDFAIATSSVPPPDLSTAFGALVAGVRSELDAGRNVVVQCRDGIGRSGLVTASVATTFGDSVQTALDRVRAVQPRAVEAPAQVAYLAQFVAQARDDSGS